jgi:hypothetical protein
VNKCVPYFCVSFLILPVYISGNAACNRCNNAEQLNDNNAMPLQQAQQRRAPTSGPRGILMPLALLYMLSKSTSISFTWAMRDSTSLPLSLSLVCVCACVFVCISCLHSLAFFLPPISLSACLLFLDKVFSHAGSRKGRPSTVWKEKKMRNKDENEKERA